MYKKTIKKQESSKPKDEHKELVDILGILMNKMDFLTGKSCSVFRS